jgi:hypothetical protein
MTARFPQTQMPIAITVAQGVRPTQIDVRGGFSRA